MMTNPAPARTVTFDELQEHLKAQHRIDVYDVNGRDGSYDRWCRRHKIKASEARGNGTRPQEIFTQYIEAPDGQDAEPDYFNFWHFLMDVAKEMKIETVTTEDYHRITIPLPTVELTQAVIAKQAAVREATVKMYRAAGVDPRRAGVAKATYEGAVEMIAKIEADFGRPLCIFAEHGR